MADISDLVPKQIDGKTPEQLLAEWDRIEKKFARRSDEYSEVYQQRKLLKEMLVENNLLLPDIPEPISSQDLILTHRYMRQELIYGLLREGETMNIIAASKAGKSWMGYQLLYAMANGIPWLGFHTNPSRCLMIDNEVHAETLAFRFRSVADQMQVPYGGFEVENLRGQACDYETIDEILTRRRGCYDFVLLDAFYRTLPGGMSENDNAAMTKVYNRIDELAHVHGCAFGIIHHSSKGDQSQKAVTDVGAGAGAMTRACDSHLVIRLHDDDDLAVLEGVTRSNPPIAPRSIRYCWPLWYVDDAVPLLKQPKTGNDRRTEKNDAKGKLAITDVLEDAGDWMARTTIASRAGMGKDRANKLLYQMQSDGQIEMETRDNPKRPSQSSDYFRLPQKRLII